MKFTIKSELIKVYEIGLEPRNELFGEFRVEIFRRTTGQLQCAAKIYRSDLYRLQPTFPQESGEPVDHQADERIFVEEEVILDEVDLLGDDPDQLIAHIMKKLSDRYLPEEK